MELRFTLKHKSARVTMTLIALTVITLLLLIVARNLVIGLLTQTQIPGRETLAAAVEFFPDTALLHARLAERRFRGHDRDLAAGEAHAQRAVNLSPYDYNHRVLLASIKEAQGDHLSAEESLKAAVTLAPNSLEVRWRLANLLLRQGELSRSVDEFRMVSQLSSGSLPATLDLLWTASDGNLDIVESVAGANPEARLTLAGFLVKRSAISEAAGVFASVDRNTRLSLATLSSSFINSLIGAGRLELARQLWLDLVDGGDSHRPLIYNGSFESDSLKGFAQFDWSIASNRFASIRIDSGTARQGGRSLRIDFTGLDTSQLNNEVHQLVAVRPGARYRLECFVKSQNLAITEGPRAVVADTGSSKWIATSDPVIAGSSDWQHLAVDFVAPQSASGETVMISISIKRKPKYSYDDPASGTVWFDDFSLNLL